ncbi:MAG TPA: capsule assembly Wzi family protein [Longimicrobiales bacterium]|nr:capsule assembly Wzi family protein [Longimicrobiales bacterium]
MSRARWVSGLVVALLLLPPLPAGAQRAPVFVEPGHWTWDAIRRLSVAGLAPPAGDHALAPVTVGHALHVFSHAEDSARSADRPFLGALAAGYRAMLELEGDTAGLVAASQLRAGWTGVRGEARGGDGYLEVEDWEGAQVLPGVQRPAVAWRGHGYIRPWLAWSADAGYLAGDAVVRSAVVSAAAGPLDLWVGRRRLHYAIGRGGGTVVGGARNETPDVAHRTTYTFQGIGAHVRDPFHFPGFLRFLGADRVEVAVGRMARVGRVDRPWVAFGRLMGSPFTERLTLGINRGAIFGGDGIPITPGRLAGLIIGLHGGEGGEFENQVFSTLVAFRPPLGVGVPLEFYVEWGMDDTAGAVRDVPAIVAGLDLAAVPGLPTMALAVERTSYAESCCGNPIWYRHIFYRGSWADEGRLFAHPLGGHGTEWLAHVRVDRPDDGLMFRVDGFRRDRGHENLFAPDRTGRSLGGSVAAELQVAGGTRMRLDGAWERGKEWDDVRAAIFLLHTFDLRR